MFLTAVARPRFDYARKTMWDGKVGMWPFISVLPEQRSSKNRARGTLITTPMTVTKTVYRKYILDHVIPAIKQAWPGPRGQPIYIQQDNARPHVEVGDAAVTAAGCSDGGKIQLVVQPAMSPDINVLDLGFFTSIQALQHRTAVTSIDKLVAAVQEALVELDWRVLDKTFVTLHKVLGESLKIGGDNSYKLPHQHKDKMAKVGPTPRMVCDAEVVRVIEVMNRRKEFERRVDNLSDVFASSAIVGSINMSNVDQLCTLVQDLNHGDNE
ncbi:hypothetical protein AaE_012209 [Aphanomyces astaci]|uniref:Tc1-like transposase DDE domain-containing protein n=1 Tax=Aphanomyces astaci TaxID=112090 RepID=A0A6A4ZD00_APHAT|nr:hypothetical protein AaE_012209 [Aphanomyces astaci]